MKFADRDTARSFFHKLTQLTRDWNYSKWDTPEFKELEKRGRAAVQSVLA